MKKYKYFKEGEVRSRLTGEWLLCVEIYEQHIQGFPKNNDTN